MLSYRNVAGVMAEQVLLSHSSGWLIRPAPESRDLETWRWTDLVFELIPGEFLDFEYFLTFFDILWHFLTFSDISVSLEFSHVFSMLQVWSNASTPWKLLYPRNIVAQARADIHLRACVSAKGIKQSTCVVLSYNLHVDFAESVEVLYCFFFY